MSNLRNRRCSSLLRQGAVIFLSCFAGMMAGLSVPTCEGAPIITSISQLSTQQIQTITITGSGFGTLGAYTGNSSDIAFFDLDHNAPDGWSAGFAGTFPGGLLPGVPSPVGVDDAVNLTVDSWTDSSIVLGGFAGAWGSNGWILTNGDNIEVFVWNPQSGSGPASITGVVGSVSGVPEPTTVALFGIGLAAWAGCRRRRV